MRYWPFTAKKITEAQFTYFELFKIGQAFIDYMASGGGEKALPAPPVLKNATRGQIRVGLIEGLIVRLKSGISFQDQIKIVEATGEMFCMHVKFFDLKIRGGTRETESKESFEKSCELWDRLQELIVRDGGKRFEVDPKILRETLYPDLMALG